MKRCFEAKSSLEELEMVAKNFLNAFPKGGIFLFPSEMGSGKTTFCRSVIKSMGYEFEGSPTFAIANQYRKSNHPTVLHADLYRIKTPQELLELGFADMVADAQYVLIEWPEKSLDYFKSSYYTITIEPISDGRRKYLCCANESSQ
jgi:tRNA threonylcarbamoyladenosine biosynthesis protein TsaE